MTHCISQALSCMVAYLRCSGLFLKPAKMKAKIIGRYVGHCGSYTGPQNVFNLDAHLKERAWRLAKVCRASTLGPSPSKSLTAGSRSEAACGNSWMMVLWPLHQYPESEAVCPTLHLPIWSLVEHAELSCQDLCVSSDLTTAWSARKNLLLPHAGCHPDNLTNILTSALGWTQEPICWAWLSQCQCKWGHNLL